MPEELLNGGYVIDFGIMGIVVIAYAAVVLVIAVVALVLLFKQKSLLAQINNTLSRQGMVAPAVPVYTPPAPNTCTKCGATYVPGSAFCQKCGTPVQG